MAGRPADDGELLSRAKRGDEDAYEEIVKRYSDIAFRTAYLITGSAADAEDATQEAFVKAFRALGGFRAGAPMRPWLMRIVANEAHNRNRSSGRRHQLELRLTEGFRQGDAAPSPEAAAAGHRQPTERGRPIGHRLPILLRAQRRRDRIRFALQRRHGQIEAFASARALARARRGGRTWLSWSPSSVN